MIQFPRINVVFCKAGPCKPLNVIMRRTSFLRKLFICIYLKVVEQCECGKYEKNKSYGTVHTYLPSLHSDQTLFYNIKGESCSEPVKIIINQSFF